MRGRLTPEETGNGPAVTLVANAVAGAGWTVRRFVSLRLHCLTLLSSRHDNRDIRLHLRLCILSPLRSTTFAIAPSKSPICHKSDNKMADRYSTPGANRKC